MSIILDASVSPAYDLHSEKTWKDLMNLLRSYVRHLVYSAHITCWRGQEEDVIEDIVQETVRRILEYSQRAEHKEVLPIYSLERISITTAHNYYVDIQRRDRRFICSLSGSHSPGNCSRDDQMSSLEIAIEHIYQEEIFTQLARAIAYFPKKQRRALLIDLANRMHFDTQLTPLQKAFLTEGIDLKAYQLSLPRNVTERARHAALLSLAYKRIARFMSGDA